MMVRKLLLATACALFLVSCAHGASGGKKVLRVPGGTNVPELGLATDASYDKRLDNLVPGYKVITVALVNASFNIIPLDPDKDRWWIKVAGERKKVPVLHNLRQQDPKAWSALPERVQKLVAYPLFIPIGARQAVDLFVPEQYDLETFTELIVKLAAIRPRIEVLVSQ